jgi:opacity protein-like surface antigen
MVMKQTSKMVMVAVALLAGVSGTAWANGTEMPPPEPTTYTPPPPPMEKPAPPPVKKARSGGPYISGAIGIGIPGSFTTDFCPSDTEDDQDGGCGEHGGHGGCGGSTPPPSAPAPQSHSDQNQDTADTANDCKFDMKSGLALTGAIGYDFGSARLEGALGYQKHDLSDVDEDISLLTVMANAYYDFGNDSDIRPYIMGGLGMAHINMSWTSDDEDVFAWQLGAGVGFKIAERTTLDLGYRYLKPSTFDTHGLGDGKLACNNIMLGLRYQF